MALQNGIPEHGAAGGSPTSAPTSVPALCEHLAQTIHDGVLQSLALSMLQAELCRRELEAGDTEAALGELRGIGPELQSAITALRAVIRDLHLAAQAGRPPA